MRRLQRIRILVFALLGLMLAGLAAVPASASSDLRILVDVSGSMRWNDPDNLRIDAMRLISELMPVGHRVGVWLFAEGTEPLMPLGVVDADWKNLLKQRVRRIHSRGRFTHIEDALSVGIQGWTGTPEPGEERHLVLFTDGVIDVPLNPADGDRDGLIELPEPVLIGEKSYRSLIDGDYASSIASRERILRDLIPTLQRLQIQTHVIALSDEVDPELVEALALQTGGWLEIAADASALQKAFLRILDQSAPPTTVPIKGNRFTIDEGVREFTLLAFHDGTAVSLITPTGTTVASGQIPQEGRSRISWNAAQDYDMVTVTAPASGEWTLQGSLDPDNRVAVLTDLNLAMSPLPNTIPEPASLLLEVWPTEQGTPVKLEEFLELTSVAAVFERVSDNNVPDRASEATDETALQAQINPPETEAPNINPDIDPHINPATIPALSLILPLDLNSLTYRMEVQGGTLKPGTYRLQTLLEGATFKRQLIRSLRVTGTPLAIHYYPQSPEVGQSGQAQLGVRLAFDSNLIRAGSLFGYLRLEGPDGQDTVLEFNALSHDSARYDLPINRAGNYKASARLRAETVAGEPLLLDPPEEIFRFDFDDGHASKPQAKRDPGAISWALLGAVVGGGTVAFATLMALVILLTRPTSKSGTGNAAARKARKSMPSGNNNQKNKATPSADQAAPKD